MVPQMAMICVWLNMEKPSGQKTSPVSGRAAFWREHVTREMAYGQGPFQHGRGHSVSRS